MEQQITFVLTENHVKQMLSTNSYITEWTSALNEILPKYEINTLKRVAMFMAQCGHESAGFRQLKEGLNYKAAALTKTWPKRFPAEIAEQYAHNAEKIANRAYADRMGNGNEASGDGYKFCGRGLIQLTGKESYTKFAAEIDMDLSEVPAYCETLKGAVESACYFWKHHNLNATADESNVEKATRIINGGNLGLDDRKIRYETALKCLLE